VRFFVIDRDRLDELDCSMTHGFDDPGGGGTPAELGIRALAGDLVPIQDRGKGWIPSVHAGYGMADRIPG
jgi:hypothetical protein